MKQQRAVKVELYPTDEQRILIHKTFGCVRAVWNDMLGDEQEFYAAADKHFIPTTAKYKKKRPYLSEVDSLALCNAQLALKKRSSGSLRTLDILGIPSSKPKRRLRNRTRQTASIMFPAPQSTRQRTPYGCQSWVCGMLSCIAIPLTIGCSSRPPSARPSRAVSFALCSMSLMFPRQRRFCQPWRIPSGWTTHHRCFMWITRTGPRTSPGGSGSPKPSSPMSSGCCPT